MSNDLTKTKYLQGLINLEFSPFHDLDVLNKIEINSYEYDIIKNNIISIVSNIVKDFSDIYISYKDNVFYISTPSEDDFKIIDIDFLTRMYIRLYDRTNIELIYKAIKEEYEKTKSQINPYGYSSQDIFRNCSRLQDSLNDLDAIRQNKELISIDDAILNTLELKDKKGILVGYEDLYETKQIYSNSKMIVYKNNLYK